MPDLVYGCQEGGLFFGMSDADKLALLTKLRIAYSDLMAGGKGESFTYSQGDGAKSVTYTRANAGGLMQLINQLMAALGVCGARRAPLRPIYRP
jgi:hypothetical protein